MREGEDWSAGKRRGVGGWGGTQSQVTFSRESSCERSAPGRRVATPLGAQRLTEPPPPQNLLDPPPLPLSSGRCGAAQVCNNERQLRSPGE